MRILFQLLSFLAILGTILPSILFFMDKMELDTMKWTMLVATIVWFAATPFWMNQSSSEEPASE